MSKFSPEGSSSKLGSVEIDERWGGMLTVDNIEAVAKQIETTLAGKKYTFVAATEDADFVPKVRTCQRLNSEGGRGGKAVTIFKDERGDYAGFNVGDSYGVWGCSTSLKNESNVRYDPEFNNPYIHFQGDQITIRHKAASGNKL